jgi:methylase of polypeptide subunit release factors
MGGWNPETPDDWSKAFRLVSVPYFGAARSAEIAGMHAMMQDGDSASFALHLTAPRAVPQKETILGWAWSSNVRHAVVIESKRDTFHAQIFRWDDPQYHDTRIIESIADAVKLVRDIERGAPPSRPDVIKHALAMFENVRAAIEERNGNSADVVMTFNTVLRLTNEWRSAGKAPRGNRDITLIDAIRRLHQSQRHGFNPAIVSSSVREYNVGELTRLVLENNSPITGYAFDTELLIRHAGGLLYQDAHRSLAAPPSGYQQRALLFDAMSGTSGRPRTVAPSYVHYTPPWLARTLVEAVFALIKDHRSSTLRILDPACGSGVFLGESARELHRLPLVPVQLHGMDISTIAGLMADFYTGEVTHDIARSRVTQSIECGIDSLGNPDWNRPDAIVMNPPFKAWKNLSSPERDRVKNVLGGLMAGRPDLYLAFLVRAAASLQPGGAFASIVPASFFTAKTAAKVRATLHGGSFRVRLVGLLRGFTTFDDAMVEAGFIVVEHSDEDSPVRIITARRGYAEKAIRQLRAISHGRSIARAGFEIFSIPGTELHNESWKPRPKADLDFAHALASATKTRVADIFTVRLGVRGGGAKGISRVLVVPERDIEKIAPTSRERQYFRPIADQIEQGQIVHSGFVFYPYGEDRSLLIKTERELQDAVPAFYRCVLASAKEKLQARKSINRRVGKPPTRQWWEPSEPVTSWLAAKVARIVSQEFGARGDFAIDETGRYAVVGGNGWCWNGGTPNIDTLFAYLAVLNSQPFERLLSVHSPRLQGGQYRLEGRFVHQIPLPNLSIGAQSLSAIGRRIHSGERYSNDDLTAIVMAAYLPAGRDCHDLVENQARDNAREFSRLSARWKHDTQHFSRMSQKATHPAYKKIIAMGPSVVSHILRDLAKNGPEDWFMALTELTGDNPITTDIAGKMKEMTEAWLQWGRRKGYR